MPSVHPEAVPSDRHEGVPAIHQFVPALLPRDATGDHTLALRGALRDAGWCSDIYVESAQDDLWPEAIYFERYPAQARPGDVLLYQLSTASPVADFLLERDELLAIDYHNVTPPSFYEGWEDHTAEKVARARVEAAALARRAALGLADSGFNAEELRHFGCRSTVVVPILTKVEDRPPVVDRAELARLAATHGPGTVLLFVGRLSPNKAQHHLVEALWFYRRWYDAEARLHLVGPSMTPSYADAVFGLAAELGLEDAVRYGEDLSDAELAAWYVDADVFVCLSEHEGFCIPLLEAMRSDLPIVAFGAGAVPETLDGAGVVLTSKRPATVAAAVDRVQRDIRLAERMVGAGHQRLRHFLPEQGRARFIDALRPLVARGLAQVRA